MANVVVLLEKVLCLILAVKRCTVSIHFSHEGECIYNATLTSLVPQSSKSRRLFCINRTLRSRWLDIGMLLLPPGVDLARMATIEFRAIYLVSGLGAWDLYYIGMPGHHDESSV